VDGLKTIADLGLAPPPQAPADEPVTPPVKPFENVRKLLDLSFEARKRHDFERADRLYRMAAQSAQDEAADTGLQIPDWAPNTAKGAGEVTPEQEHAIGGEKLASLMKQGLDQTAIPHGASGEWSGPPPLTMPSAQPDVTVAPVTQPPMSFIGPAPPPPAEVNPEKTALLAFQARQKGNYAGLQGDQQTAGEMNDLAAKLGNQAVIQETTGAGFGRAAVAAAKHEPFGMAADIAGLPAAAAGMVGAKGAQRKLALQPGYFDAYGAAEAAKRHILEQGTGVSRETLEKAGLVEPSEGAPMTLAEQEASPPAGEVIGRQVGALAPWLLAGAGVGRVFRALGVVPELIADAEEFLHTGKLVGPKAAMRSIRAQQAIDALGGAKVAGPRLAALKGAAEMGTLGAAQGAGAAGNEQAGPAEIAARAAEGGFGGAIMGAGIPLGLEVAGRVSGRLLRPFTAGAEVRPNAPSEFARGIVNRYQAKQGLPPVGTMRYWDVNPDLGERVAHAYEQMKSEPDNPKVKASYDALKAAIHGQFETMKESGLRIEFVDESPYPNSKAMILDVEQHNRLKVLKTSPEQAHPGMTPEENNELRAVHDLFAHAAHGNQFGPHGEFNAWLAHAQTLPKEARGALTSETHGQNSWVNFGPDRDLPQGLRRYAEQKAGLLPEEFLRTPEEQSLYDRAIAKGRGAIARKLADLKASRAVEARKEAIRERIDRLRGERPPLGKLEGTERGVSLEAAKLEHWNKLAYARAQVSTKRPPSHAMRLAEATRGAVEAEHKTMDARTAFLAADRATASEHQMMASAQEPSFSDAVRVHARARAEQFRAEAASLTERGMMLDPTGAARRAATAERRKGLGIPPEGIAERRQGPERRALERPAQAPAPTVLEHPDGTTSYDYPLPSSGFRPIPRKPKLRRTPEERAAWRAQREEALSRAPGVSTGANIYSRLYDAVARAPRGVGDWLQFLTSKKQQRKWGSEELEHSEVLDWLRSHQQHGNQPTRGQVLYYLQQNVPGLEKTLYEGEFQRGAPEGHERLRWIGDWMDRERDAQREAEEMHYRGDAEEIGRSIQGAIDERDVITREPDYSIPSIQHAIVEEEGAEQSTLILEALNRLRNKVAGSEGLLPAGAIPPGQGQRTLDFGVNSHNPRTRHDSQRIIELLGGRYETHPAEGLTPEQSRQVADWMEEAERSVDRDDAIESPHDVIADYGELPGDLREKLVAYKEASGELRYTMHHFEVDQADLRAQAEAEFEDQFADRERNEGTTYQQYTLPGGTNYKEHLLVLKNPRGQHFTEAHEFAHQGQEDLLLHYRVKDRTDLRGRPVRFIEEVQSDWAQKGKRQGYTPVRVSQEKVNQARAALAAAHQAYLDRQHRVAGPLLTRISEIDNEHARLDLNPPPAGLETREAVLRRRHELVAEREKLTHERQFAMSTDAELRRLGTAVSEARDALGQAEGIRGVPEMPYKETEAWLTKAVQHIVDDAVNDGIDHVVWTTGAQQAKRYSLRGRVDRIEYHPLGGDRFHWEAYRNSMDAQPVYQEDASAADLPEKLGAAITKRMLAGEGSPRAEEAGDRGVKVLSDERLEIGGEGLGALYDKMLPQVIRAYGKRLGLTIDVEKGGSTKPGQGYRFKELGQREAAPPADQLVGTPTLAKVGPPSEAIRNETNMYTPRLLNKMATVLLQGGDDEWSRDAARRMIESALEGRHWDTDEPAKDPQALVEAAHEVARRIGLAVTEPPTGEASPGQPGFAIPEALKAMVKGGGQPGYTKLGVVGGLAGAGAGAAAGAALTPGGKREKLVGALAGAAAVPALMLGGGRFLKALRERGAAGRLATEDRLLPVPEGTAGQGRRGGPAGYPAGPEGAPREAAGTRYKAAVDEGTDPRMINVAKFNLDPEGELELRDRTQRLVDAGMEKKKVSWDETRALANVLGMDPHTVQRAAGDWSGAQALAARDIVAQNTRRIVDLGKVIRNPLVGDEERAAAIVEQGGLVNRNALMLNRFAKERSQAGRDLNTYKMLAANTMDPATWQVLATRVKGQPLAADEMARIGELTRSHRRDELVAFVQSLHHSTALDKALTLWKAGLLTGPTTHMVNVASNITSAVLENAKEPVAVAADYLIALLRYERGDVPTVEAGRTKAYPILPQLQAQWEAIPEGIRQGTQVLKKGATQASAAFWNFQSTRFDSPLLQAYTDGVFRALSAEDVAAMAPALARTLAENVALHMKRVDNLKPGTPEWDAKWTEYRKNPPAPAVARATVEAQYATFHQENALATWVSSFARQAQRQGKPFQRAAAEVVMPFVKQPLNVTSNLIDYSPFGLFRTLAAQVGDPNQKELAEGLARSMTGSALVWYGVQLAKEGKATGSAPIDEAERTRWQEEGKQANSVLIDGNWVHLGRISPAGMLVSLGAQFYNSYLTAQQKAETPASKAAMTGALAAASLGRIALDQSFMKGVSGALGAVNDPLNAGERFMEQTVGSVVPGAVQRVARGLQEHQLLPQGPVQQIGSEIPGGARALAAAGDTIPERVRPLGEPVESPGVAGSLFDPLNVTPDRTSPSLREMDRLGVRIPTPLKARANPVTGQREQRPVSEVNAMKTEQGPALRAVMDQTVALPEYGKLPDDLKKEFLASALSAVTATTTAKEKARLAGHLEPKRENPAFIVADALDRLALRQQSLEKKNILDDLVTALVTKGVQEFAAKLPASQRDQAVAPRPKEIVGAIRHAAEDTPARRAVLRDFVTSLANRDEQGAAAAVERAASQGIPLSTQDLVEAVKAHLAVQRLVTRPPRPAIGGVLP
jgi:hypothetical protein